MHARALALSVTLAAFVIACGSGGGGGEAGAVRTPAASAPRNVIVFGATGQDGQHALYLMQADGTGIQELTTDDAPVSFPRWSPDGDRIAYVSGEPGGPASLRVYDFDGSITTTVGEQVLNSGDEAPFAWSPDGSRMAFIEASGSGTLRIFNLNDSAPTDDSVPASAVAWASNGVLAIVAPSDDGSSTDIYTFEPGHEAPEPLLEREGLEGGLAWSPDGETLAFWSAPSAELAERALFLLASGGGDPEVVAPGTDATWSRTAQLAYSANTAVGETGVLDVYRRSGAGLERLTQSLTLDRWSSWSPEEDAIVYLAEADASTSFLCLVIVETIDNNCVNLPGLNPSAPAWSPY